MNFGEEAESPSRPDRPYKPANLNGRPVPRAASPDDDFGYSHTDIAWDDFDTTKPSPPAEPIRSAATPERTPAPPRPRESPALRQASSPINDAFLAGDQLPDAPEVARAPAPQRRPPGARPVGLGARRLVIAIDFGTTFTGVAFATPAGDQASLEDIDVVLEWGTAEKSVVGEKVPSVMSYTLTRAGFAQWGYQIAPDSLTMILLKLELDTQPNLADELELILRTLDGTGNLKFEHIRTSTGPPAYPSKEPEVIVTDYLTKVYAYVSTAVSYFGKALKTQIPVDITITVPEGWSYRAKNATLRAIRKAGFNEVNFPNLQDMLMITEPEAAAIYTARYFKERLGSKILEKDDCFVVVDAGGGTVDVITYRVMVADPLQLQLATVATSAKCGASYIDGNFKRWVRKVLGDKNFRLLAPRKYPGQRMNAFTSEGQLMRNLMQQFDGHKKRFELESKDVVIDLPDLTHVADMPSKIEKGGLKITKTDMMNFFDPCVGKIIKLVDGHISQVEEQGRRVKTIFLAGGFGESLYLRQRLELSMGLRDIDIKWPAKPWSAVVRGAVIYGIEKDNHSNVVKLATASRSYGIAFNEPFKSSKFSDGDRKTDAMTNKPMANRQVTWFVKKGDLVLFDRDNRATKKCGYCFYEEDHSKKTIQLPIYEFKGDNLPTRFSNSAAELGDPVAELSCSLNKFDLSLVDQYINSQKERPYYAVEVECKAILEEKTATSPSTLRIELWWEHLQEPLDTIVITNLESPEPLVQKAGPAQPGNDQDNDEEYSSGEDSYGADDDRFYMD